MSEKSARLTADARKLQISTLRRRVEIYRNALMPIWKDTPEVARVVHEVVANATSLTALRALIQEFRTIAAHLEPHARQALAAQLGAECGADPDELRDIAVVQRVLARGRIKSEREYWVVQAFADSMVRSAEDSATEAEYLRVGALLDAFTAGVRTSDQKPPTKRARG